jgi:alpha-D-ribose 1-methylphosphonate 5-triphosphate synthase subunit PhnG
MAREHDQNQECRAEAMRLFALTPWDVFDTLSSAYSREDAITLRGPDTGLVMLRGRMGGTGDAFNLGEITVTRCTVKRPSGIAGHAYIQGRNSEHAKRAALCDALFQESPERMTALLQSLTKRLDEQRQQANSKAAATKVDFFTMVRGDA